MKTICAVLFTIIFALPSWAEPLTIVTENFPPYNYEENGQAKGLSTEVVQAILKEVGLQADINFLPWQRAYRDTQDKKNYLIYSIARIPEREKMFHWVGPIAPYKTSFYKLKSNKSVQVNSLEEAKQYQVGVSSEDVILIYLKGKGFSSFHMVYNDIFNIRMLAHGRINLIAYDEASFIHVVQAEGFSPSLFERVFRLDELSDNLYMAFNLKSDPDLVQSFTNGLEIIQMKGIFDKIQSTYLELE